MQQEREKNVSYCYGLVTKDNKFSNSCPPHDGHTKWTPHGPQLMRYFKHMDDSNGNKIINITKTLLR